MGGRGAASGISKQGKKYGTEYKTLLTDGNIKFIENNNRSSKTPMETMTKGRVYVLVSSKTRQLKSITYFDSEGKRFKSVHLDHSDDNLKPHTHEGYFHNESHTRKEAKPRKVNDREQRMIQEVNRIWKRHRSS
ncbi:hypothetical protein PT279_08960 [Bifidobacterium sp. ESL0784]|uniref:hypothetical protein n=1 Tax=Bifidobacterium sp. ESL0784 TaxID=2983231 RepID=UPI0023F95760|nr:hypothetical protein [Bifidobacterium sp. ESL0784]MDF7641711.1 hypothetical protein [Bifidobacterium sp. ESL0784]